LLENEDSSVVNDLTITGGRTLVGKSLFDWKINAKQQIGIVISRIYKNIKDSFQSTNN
jgi:hypothetical protein